MRIFDSKSGKSFVRKCRRRYDEAGHTRELTFSCFRRFQFLNRDRTRLWFVEALEGARQEWPFDLWAYVVMPEHVHLLVHSRHRKLAFGKMAGDIKEEVARKAIEYLEKHAPEWLPRITVHEGERVRVASGSQEVVTIEMQSRFLLFMAW
jgi:REP-associated tyrosine transposase